MNYRSSRLLFEYYRSIYSGSDTWPIVVDGDDLVSNTKSTVDKLCKAIGIDESLIKYEWDKKETDKGPVDRVFRGKLLDSTGVISDEASRYTLVAVFI
jgi:hypothetical protein